MAPKSLTGQFFEGMFPLLNRKYDPSMVNTLEARSLVDKFIFQPLPDDQKAAIIKRAKSHRMPIPPPLDSIIDMPSVTDQVNLVIKMISEGKTLEQIYEAFSGTGMSITEFNFLLSAMSK